MTTPLKLTLLSDLLRTILGDKLRALSWDQLKKEGQSKMCYNKNRAKYVTILSYFIS
jgi:hypothetical protein